MGYNKAEKVQVKLEFLRMLVRLELDPARNKLISGFFDTYIKLDDKEKQQLKSEIKNLDEKEEVKIMELTTSWHEEGQKDGIQKGEKKAKLEIARNLLKAGMSIEFIAKTTSLPQKEIEAIKNSLEANEQ